jgi:hypothetical protein
MKRLLILLIGLAMSASALAFQPRTGLWWNPGESGSGYNIEIQNGVLVVTVFSYKGNGDSEWYLASGALTNSGHTFSGTLDKYRNGQCISCAYTGTPTLAGNDGTMSINFVSETSAILSLPNGRTTLIEPQNFGFQALPVGFFGEWIYVYDIGFTTFAERFNYSATLPPTSGGNGIAQDVGRNAGCELQVVGALAGIVLCVDLDGNGVLVNQYAYRYGLDETYGGVYTYPPSGNNYTMKGFRLRGSNGASKATEETDDVTTTARKAQLAPRTAAVARDPALTAAFEAIAAALRAAPR